MNFVQHSAIGIGTAGLGLWGARSMGLPQPELETVLIGTAIIAAGSIAVDIDHHKSFVSWGLPRQVLKKAMGLLLIPLVPFVVFAPFIIVNEGPNSLWKLFEESLSSWLQASWFQWTLAFAASAIVLMVTARVVSGILDHRGPTHTLVGAAVATAVPVAISASLELAWQWGLLFGWGWLWHIIADGLTKWGVPLWWPFSDDRVHILPDPLWKPAGIGLLAVSVLTIVLLFFSGWLGSAGILAA